MVSDKLLHCFVVTFEFQYFIAFSAAVIMKRCGLIGIMTSLQV